MAPKANHISIVQFDERRISRLRVRMGESDAGTVVSCDVVSGDWPRESGALEQALREFVGRFNVGEDVVCTVLPRHDITTRILQLPSNDAAEIAGMVRFSAEDCVPFSIDELRIDQCILQQLPSGESSVLAAFAHRDVVDQHMNLLQAAGVVPDHIYLSTACLATVARAVPPSGEGCFALVHPASGGLEVVIFDAQGTLLFGRGVASGQRWRPEEGGLEGMAEELAVELRATIGAFRRESPDGADVDRVYLCGETTGAAALSDALAAESGRTCTAWDPVAGLFPAPGQEGADRMPAAAGAVLLAQGRSAVSIDLVPESVTQGRRMRVAQKRVLRVAGLVGLVALGVAGWFYQQLWQREAYLKELEGRLATIRAKSGGVAEKWEQLRILRDEVRPTGSVLQYLANISQAVPEKGLNITEFRFSHEEGIDIKGRAESLDLISTFGQVLRDLGKKGALAAFANATRMYENDGIAEQNAKVWEYHYSIPLGTTGEAPEDAASASAR